jgi:leader peptidase (prepilin peptidase)/N-methyltransferase
MGLAVFILAGFLAGGIINILADDLPLRRRPRLPRCEETGERLPAHLWLGTIRRLVTGGRCPGCGRPEGWRPVIVEVATAATFGLVWVLKGGWSPRLAITAIYFAVFILIFVTDMEHRLILHIVTFPSIVFALLASPVTVTPMSALLGAAVGFGLFSLIYLLGSWIFGSGAMGFGDVTLATLIGAAVGLPTVIVALLSGILAGGAITLLLLATRLRRLRSKVPYGPFLLAGAAIGLLWGPQIVTWYLS